MAQENIVIGPELERILDSSLGELLLLLLKTHGDNILQVDGVTDEILPANILLARAIQLAKWFQKEGIVIDDCISVSSENRLEFGVVPVATLFVGATFAPLNFEYTAGELKHVLSLSKPKIIFCSEKTINTMVSIRSSHPYVKKIVAFGKQKPSHKNVVWYEDIIKDAKEVDEDFEAVPVDPKEAVATILCSSGTTGLPKGVMCTHDSMNAFIDIGRTFMTHIVENDDPSDALMGLTPFFHSFGFMLMFLNILRGKKMVVLAKFHLKTFLEAIVRHKVVRLIVPPPVLIILLKHPLVQKYNLASLKEIRSGAASLGKDLERELKERFNVEQVSQAYGMTETTLGVLITPSGGGKLGSVGKLVPGMMAKVLDENDKALGPYEEGEICFKGPLIMKGYVGDVQATSATIDKDGWLHTGDIAYYDNEGYFFIVDRIKELIKYKAFQVAPAELEALLLTHPSVQDAAVIGLPDDDAGELPLAYVVRRPNSKVMEAQLEKFVADNVSSAKRLRGGVIFIDEIPKNPTGKILRRVLRARAIKMKSKL